ncbi:uncharacterized protein LOC133022049 [Limanda limanda]|uniref:uncharacterized protein LOC133022049 n=1 Tax=Limanda limanda TaxID=27771 RepID=UPI0029C8EE24|nr:uncharacterized protein LOC133022049 [Limanda limanda]
MSLHLLLLLIPFTVLAVQYSSIIIRAGAEVTLPCDNVRDDHVNCGATEWLFSDIQRNTTVNLFVNRQLSTSEISKSKADRLRLAANCSLVIREVTAEDAGEYDCRQFDRTARTYEGHLLYISVVNVTEQKRTDEVTLSCSVSPSVTCSEVKWLFMNMDVQENNKDLKTSQSSCSANVSFSKSHFDHKMKNYSSLTCEVDDGDKEEKFSFIPPSSGKNTDWWWYIALVVGFASIIQGGDVAVASSTVEAPSSSTGPSADPSSLDENVTIIP